MSDGSRKLLAYLRRCVLITAATAATTALGADGSYIQLPGITAPASGAPYSGWFEVAQQTVALVPGIYDADGKVVASNCSATVRTRLGAAGAAVAQLVGTGVGNVKLETVSGATVRYRHQVVLRNAVLVQHTMSFEDGANHDTLFFHFDAADVTSYDVRSDGTRGSGTQGTFDCLLAR